MNVSIVGAGYVGLISGVCLASKGHNVSCFDINGEVVTSLNKGIPTFYEKGLKKILSYVIEKQNQDLIVLQLYVLICRIILQFQKLADYQINVQIIEN